ncbi:glycerophosphodiester phosphodiesterase family protein [Chryseolinea sp. H1M3-3]|uniref:glycerophosphodiester phosphodiesterase family protein n=1 Tax=Chryseolinea sp. H1M3-3 TaxID=3034144 RepID=UPI0023EBA244|nr:glycerophosphodiester phosphodiesterase family protein [Chryseolinea sp. H1M3-3]
MKRFFYFQFFLLCSAVAFGQQNADAIRRTFLDANTGTVLVASHRATHNVYPENSLKAIQESIRIGVDIIEIDVKVSKDGVPFLMHDRTLDRTTTGKGDPEEFTWDELQQLFIIDKGKRTSLKIPSLKDALELAYGKILVDLDLKTDKVEEVIGVVNKTDTKDIVFFFDSDYKVLSRIHAADKDFMIMPRAHSIEQADSAISLFDPPVVHIDFSFYNPECVQSIQSSYARIWINALGDADKDIKSGKEKRALKKLLQHGANVIQTDEPQLLLQALRERGLHP